MTATARDPAAGRAQAVRGALFALATACVPLPMAFVTISFSLLALVSLALLRPAGLARAVRGNAALVAVLALVAWIGVRCIGSEAPAATALREWGTYHSLALVPVFVAAPLSREWRTRALAAFVGGSLVAAAISWARFAAWIPPLDPPVSYAPPHGPIGGGWLLALAAFACALRWRFGPARERPWLAAAIAATLGVVVFLTASRTAWLVVVVLAGVALAGAGARRWALALAVLALAAAAAWLFAPYAGERVAESLAPVRAAKPETSTEIRKEMYRVTANVVASAPVAGHGTGSFGREFEASARALGSGVPMTLNPHSQYLLFAAETGVVGVVLFGAVLLAGWREARAREPFDRALLRGVVLSMAVSCLFNSFLIDGAESRAFALLFALALMAPADAARPGATR